MDTPSPPGPPAIGRTAGLGNTSSDNGGPMADREGPPQLARDRNAGTRWRESASLEICSGAEGPTVHVYAVMRDDQTQSRLLILTSPSEMDGVILIDTLGGTLGGTRWHPFRRSWHRKIFRVPRIS